MDSWTALESKGLAGSYPGPDASWCGAHRKCVRHPIPVALPRLPGNPTSLAYHLGGHCRGSRPDGRGASALDISTKHLFLWGTTLAGLIVLAGASAPFVPQAYLFGSPALVFLSATFLHFHLLFPLEVEAHHRFPLLVVLYTLAGMLTTAWLLRSEIPSLRPISRGYFIVAMLAAWTRMVAVGWWWNMSLEEKWAARWLAPVLALGGLLPTGGILLAEMVVGRAAIPLAVAYLVVPVVPLG